MRTLAWIVLACAVVSAAGGAEEKAVLAAVQSLFDGMSAHDAGKIQSAMTADAKVIRTRAGSPPSSVSRDQFAASVAASKMQMLERIWSPEVRVRGDIATVWAEYDFHADGKFHHCGIDSFQLVKTGEGWKTASISYTAETEGCAPSPLGPPKQ